MKIILVLSALVVLSLASYLWFRSQLAPVSADTQTRIFVIKKGQSVDAVGRSLKAAGLIRSPLIFKLLVMQARLAQKIQAGTFRLSPSQSTQEITQNLTHGTLDVWVTLPEGWRREEMAAQIKKAYDEAGAVFNDTEFLALTKTKEGYLFPDTYLFPLGANAEAIVTILSETFTKKVPPALTKEALIMASLVEREAKSSESRKMVAGILWKRLQNSWPLQVDATLQYALGFDETSKSWWRPPTALDKNIASPFNTYLHPSLPPAPICNPSLDSIQAALNPTDSDYWYYLTGNDNQMHYAKTLEEHNQNIAAYLR